MSFGRVPVSTPYLLRLLRLSGCSRIVPTVPPSRSPLPPRVPIRLATVARVYPRPQWPYCDGAHVKHNKETGDNVGPLVIDTAAPKE